MHGQFIWYELTTPDPAAAQKFYPRFTGWGTQKFDDDYTMWTNAGKPVGGIFRLGADMRSRGVPPNWMPYIEAADVDETARRVTSLGGLIINGPADIPGTGRYAVAQDPQGAVFGIYKPSGPSIAWDGTPVLGRFSWHELMTTDRKAAWEFYKSVFGWEIQSEMDMGGGNMYAMFGQGGAGTGMYGGMFDRPAEMSSMRPFWLCYVYVKDVGKAVDIATKAGAFVQRPRMDIPGGTIAILGDPQGAGFALHDSMVGAAKSQWTPEGEAKKSVGASRPKAAAKSKPKRKTKAKPKATAARKKNRSAVRKSRPAARKKVARKRSPTKAVKRRSTKKATKRRRR